MLSDREIAARKKFFSETGKTPEQEGRDAAAGLGYLMAACGVMALLAGLFCLWH